MNPRRTRPSGSLLLVFTGLLTVTMYGCDSDQDDDGNADSGEPCQSGAERSCRCATDGEGTESCLEGEWSTCTCEDVDGTTDSGVADVGSTDAGTPDADTTDAALDAEPVVDAEPPRLPCNDGLRQLPEGLVELAWDDGEGIADISQQTTWAIVDVPLASTVLHESVAFGLDHPARVHGFAIQYGNLPDGAETPITAGLYPDFSHNGFDFWPFDPYWEGSRCRGDFESGEWVRYVLDEPVEIDHPGLVYVSHLRSGADDSAWLFDNTLPTPDCEPNACCATFGSCHSAWNLPELTEFEVDNQLYFQWNGLTSQFSRDYLVRLYVEYTDDLQPEERLFQPIEDVESSNRMAWGDYDNDGDDDLLVNGPRLYRNDDGQFVSVTEESGLAALEIAGSGVFGDYDNDGCLDVFLFEESYDGAEHLLHNTCDGTGTFTNVTEATGITDLQDYNLCHGDHHNAPTPAAAWIDIDGDGYLDLYLANFICWTDYSFYTDAVWHNEADGTFTEWTGAHGFRGLRETRRSGRGASPIDYDQDGDVDLFVNHYTLHPNFFYRNNGDGTVERAGESAGLRGNRVNFRGAEYYGHSIGAAWGDLNGDAHFDLVVANLAHPRFWNFSDKSQVLINDGEGRFDDIQGDFAYPVGAAGLRYQETHSVPILADFNQDGHLDLAISAVYDGRPTDFYWGNGDGTFRLDAYHAGITVTNGWGMAAADIDHDGDMDLATSLFVFENTGQDLGHWLQVRVVGNERANRSALGATVRATRGDRTWIRHVNGSTGQGCQDSLYLHFGLGEIDQIDTIEVIFPVAGGGHAVTYEGPLDVDQRLWLYEDGTMETGWMATP